MRPIDSPAAAAVFRKRIRFVLARPAVATALALFSVLPAAASNVSTGTAIKFGVYEIVLTGDGAVANPFDTLAAVKFVPPSGEKNAKTVPAFYDGGSTWRARVYVSEVGAWSWSSASATDRGLNGKRGAFQSADSKLRGRLLPHSKNPRQWMTEDGRWFLHVGDTAYYLLSSYDENGEHIADEHMAAYVRDAADHGITSFLTYAVSGPGGCFDEDARRWTDAYFEDTGFERLRLNFFRCSDRRLLWLLEHYPDISIQLILFPRGSAYQTDERFWDKLSATQKERILRQMIARYAAFPQIVWLVACDVHYGKSFPNNNAMAREVGAYFREHDPWQHPLSTHHARFLDFQFADEDWATFIFLENACDLGASQYAKYHRFAKPVLLGEDRYEQYDPDRDPIDMRYFQRRELWAWLLSGGSANYGGRWWVLHPYTQTGERASDHHSVLFKAPLRGLDSVKFIREFFEKRKIDLSDFEPDHRLARDPDNATEARSPKLMRRGREEYLVYHPNATTDDRESRADVTKTARIWLDLKTATGTFQVEWFRVHDGAALDAGTVAGGAVREFLAPWKGHDAVLRLIAKVGDRAQRADAGYSKAAGPPAETSLPDPRDGGNGSTPIVIDPEYPHSFRYQNGERFFPMGDTAYALLGGPKDVIARYIDVRRAHKFNFIRIMAAANGNWPFGGTPERPDYTVINEQALQKLDWLFDYAASKDMNIELILWGYGVEGGEGLWANQAHQNLWIDTLTKRYKGRSNLLMYTVANEFERYPDGKYVFHPSDVEWAQGVAARIREQDSIHPIGCHPSVWITNQDPPNKGPRPFANYKGFTQRRPQVVWPLWDKSAVNLNVTQNNEGVQRRTWGDFDGGHGLTYHLTHWQGVDYPARWTDAGWDFEGGGMEDCIAEDWARGKPVLNTEFGYQFEPGIANPNPTRTKGWAAVYSSRQCHDPAATRKKAWKIATAGGYFAAGFSNSWSGELPLGEIDNFRPANLETLYDFFTTRTEYWKMVPHLELVASHNSVLAKPGVEYVAYFPRGGTNSVELVAGRFAVEWLHAESGRYFPQPAFTAADGSREFVPPERPGDDWVLHLRRTD